MRGSGSLCAAARAALIALPLAAGGCNFSGDVGYVEVKTVPVSVRWLPPLYLDEVKLAPIKNGVAVLRQAVGTSKLATGAGDNLMLLCRIDVRKDRITTVTVSVLERPPRCHCRMSGDDKNLCTS